MNSLSVDWLFHTFLLVSHQGFFSAQVRDEDGDEGMVDMQISTIKLSHTLSISVCI